MAHKKQRINTSSSPLFWREVEEATFFFLPRSFGDKRMAFMCPFLDLVTGTVKNLASMWSGLLWALNYRISEGAWGLCVPR